MCDQQYIAVVKEILEKGELRDNRTDTPTISIFGVKMEFDLSSRFPILTTKSVFWRAIVEELLFFIRGDTNGMHLLEKKINIWRDHGSRSHLDNCGLSERAEHDLGPIYGFQWRHFGAEYKDASTNYAEKGVDQLKEVIKLIKTDPGSRRIVLTAWNPTALSKMALPPCHMFCQFYVSNGVLSCQLYQRSADFGLGIPFNISSYALLTHILARICDLKVGKLHHVIGDAHIYVDHVDSIKEQISREPFEAPILEISEDLKTLGDFEKWTTDAEKFKLIDYKCHKKTYMKMAI
jgi:thymidylate synthase